MVKGIVIRSLGVLFVITGLLSLWGLSVPEVQDQMVSVYAAVVRYLFMVAFGVGLMLLRKWGVYLFGFGIILNWVIFFTTYGGEGSMLPPWASLIGQGLLFVLFYYSWGRLE